MMTRIHDATLQHVSKTSLTSWDILFEIFRRLHLCVVGHNGLKSEKSAIYGSHNIFSNDDINIFYVKFRTVQLRKVLQAAE